MPGAELGSAVIIDPAFLGDVVFDAPLVRALKARNPGCRVGLVVRPPADVIARRMTGVDAVHVFDKRGSDRGIAGLRRVARQLAEIGYEAAYVPHPSPRSALLARLARIPARVGAARSVSRWLFTRRVEPDERDTFPGARLRLLDPALAGDEAAESLQGGLRGGRDPQHGSRHARIGLVLGSAWETKRWPVESAADLARALDPDRHRLVLLGSAAERPLFDALLALARGPILDAAEDRVGCGVDELLDALAGCAVVVGGDTGPIHAARALGVPTVALFGPTPEARHRFDTRDAVLTVPLECRPCSAHGDRRCPLGHHRCMRELDPGRVRAALERALDPAG